MVQFIKRDGMHIIYGSDKGIIWVGNCTDPNVYLETGYYVEATKRLPKSLWVKPFRTARQAAIATYNALRG